GRRAADSMTCAAARTRWSDTERGAGSAPGGTVSAATPRQPRSHPVTSAPDHAATESQPAAPTEAERPMAEEPLGEQFLNVVVHDLKTPLTSVRGYAQLAERRLDRGQYEGVRQSLHVIDREVGKMTRMLRNILNVARLQAGPPALRLQELELNGLVRDVAEAVGAASGRHIECRSSGTSLVGRWDRDRLLDALYNVVENATIFAPEGPIAIEIRALGPDAAEIRVRDEG